jgi:sugar phosphate permease
MSTKTFGRAMLLPWLICGLGAVFYCYEYFLRITPSVMTSELMSAYDLKGGEIGNLSAFYYHAYVPMQIIVGLLMDRYGPRRLLTIACVLCAFGSYLFAGHYGFAVAEFGRFVIGFGSAFAFVGALKLATIWLPPNRFALVSGIIMCLGMIGAMMGDVLLREMVDAIGWQTTIYASAVAGLVLAVFLWLIIRDSSPDHPNHHTHVINFKGVLKGLALALKNPQIWLNGIVGFLMYLSLSAFAELWGIPYLEQAHGLSKTYAAYANSMIFLGWAVGSPAWGWFSDHIQRRCLPIIIGSIGAFLLILFLLYVPHLSTAMVYGVLFLFGIFSSVQILVFAICHETSKMKVAGTAIALTNMIVMIGGNVFQPFIGKLLDMEWSHQLVGGARVYSGHAYQIALSVIPIGLFIAAFIVIFLIRETHATMESGR